MNLRRLKENEIMELAFALYVCVLCVYFLNKYMISYSKLINRFLAQKSKLRSPISSYRS